MNRKGASSNTLKHCIFHQMLIGFFLPHTLHLCATQESLGVFGLQTSLHSF